MLRFLFPKEEGFFVFFEQAAENVRLVTAAFQDLVENYTSVEQKVRKIKDLEHHGDQLTHRIFEKLNTSFITPIDREDIHELAARIDDIVDLIDAAAARLYLYRIAEPTSDSREMAALLVSTSDVLKDAIFSLRNLKKRDHILQHCIAIKGCEEKGDLLLRKAMANLFEKVKDPVLIIKWKEIYEDLETASDKCDDVANVLENITLKNA